MERVPELCYRVFLYWPAYVTLRLCYGWVPAWRPAIQSVASQLLVI